MGRLFGVCRLEGSLLSRGSQIRQDCGFVWGSCSVARGFPGLFVVRVIADCNFSFSFRRLIFRGISC